MYHHHLLKNPHIKKKDQLFLFFAITWWQVPFVIDSLAEVARSNLGSGAQELLAVHGSLALRARQTNTRLVARKTREFGFPLLFFFLLLLLVAYE